MKVWNWILFIGSLVCMGLGIYFLIQNNLFLSIVSIITSSFFSSTRKYWKLQSEINELKHCCCCEDKNLSQYEEDTLNDI